MCLCSDCHCRPTVSEILFQNVVAPTVSWNGAGWSGWLCSTCTTRDQLLSLRMNSLFFFRTLSVPWGVFPRLRRDVLRLFQGLLC